MHKFGAPVGPRGPDQPLQEEKKKVFIPINSTRSECEHKLALPIRHQSKNWDHFYKQHFS